MCNSRRRGVPKTGCSKPRRLRLLPLKPELSITTLTHVRSSLPGDHLDRLAHEPHGVSCRELPRRSNEALDVRGQTQAEAGEEGRQGAASDQGHKNEHEDPEGMAAGMLGEVAEEVF